MSRTGKKLFRFLEFFFVGLALGIGEDLIAIKLITDEPINSRMIIIAAVVAFPFAIFSELIVDHPNFWQKLFRQHKKESKK